MPTAVLADVHSNLEALQACLAHARRQGATRLVFLGDLVGYGADPLACLDIIRQEAANGAIVVRGNHDEAALGGLCEAMEFSTREAIYWTRTQLGADEREFLASLPLTATIDDCLFVHASAHTPEAWPYIVSPRQARECLSAAGEARLIFAGHVHHQTLYHEHGETVGNHTPAPGVAIPLPGRWRWLALVGSVGQPRDDNPAAGYLLHDAGTESFVFHRVPYDHRSTATKIRAAGLPERLALRLQHGH